MPKSSTAPITPEQYASHGGGLCPFCGSDAIEGREVTVEGNKGAQEVSCNDCEGEWTDEYTLTGYFVVKD